MTHVSAGEDRVVHLNVVSLQDALERGESVDRMRITYNIYIHIVMIGYVERKEFKGREREKERERNTAPDSGAFLWAYTAQTTLSQISVQFHTPLSRCLVRTVRRAGVQPDPEPPDAVIPVRATGSAPRTACLETRS